MPGHWAISTIEPLLDNDSSIKIHSYILDFDTYLRSISSTVLLSVSAQSSLSVFTTKYLRKCEDTYFIFKKKYLCFHKDNFGAKILRDDCTLYVGRLPIFRMVLSLEGNAGRFFPNCLNMFNIQSGGRCHSLDKVINIKTIIGKTVKCSRVAFSSIPYN